MSKKSKESEEVVTPVVLRRKLRDPFINYVTGEIRSHKFKPPVKSNRHPRLSEDGAEILDSMPLNTEMIGMRPLTTYELMQKFDSGIISPHLVPVDFELFSPTDTDFQEHLEGDDEYISPWDDRALALNEKVRHLEKLKRKQAKKAAKAEKMRQRDLEELLANPPKPSSSKPSKASSKVPPDAS